MTTTSSATPSGSTQPAGGPRPTVGRPAADATVAPNTLVARGVGKSYVRRGHRRGAPAETTAALTDINFTLPAGQFLTIIGPSGCGKSTLMAAIAGLVPYDVGTLEFDGRPINGPGLERAVVFQQASLLPWRSVRDNVKFGLRMQRELRRSEIDSRVAEAIRTVNLEGFEDFYPGQLSGGMQQRVNLARALSTRPSLLLMDEPFAAVDALTKQTLQDELSRISAETSCTIVFVTHDIEEALFLGDQVLVMSKRPGTVLRIEQMPWSRPRSRELFDDPKFRETGRELRSLLTGPAGATDPDRSAP